jgi:aryl-alcohol dehydrogenase-like predicted oxidoreductase
MTIPPSQQFQCPNGLPAAPLALGCWPLAGMTRSGVTRDAAIRTIAAALDHGINHLDTAYCYGERGESETAIATAIRGQREQVFLASKCGIHWQPDRRQTVDGRPERIRAEVEESLQRLQTDHLDLVYLHAPDPYVPVEVSAAALRQLLQEGKTRAVGLSNGSVTDNQRFATACPLAACQRHFNMLQQEIRPELLPWCRDHGVKMTVYWPLMKGLLAGGMTREQTFPKTDSRHKYPMFQGEEFQRNLEFVAIISKVADRLGLSVVALVLAWTMAQPGIASVLVGATSPEQVAVNAQALNCRLDESAHSEIAAAINNRGTVIGGRKV